MITKKQRELQDSWNKILKKYSNLSFSSSPPKQTKRLKRKPLEYKPSPYLRETNIPSLSSMDHGIGAKPIKDKSLLEAEKKLAKRVGLQYNKGGLQYLTDSDLQAMQRGELRRRS